MTNEAMQSTPPYTTPLADLPYWIEPPGDLIFDDGEPLESNRHRIAMNLLIRTAQQAYRDRPDSFFGGNMFIYYSREQVMNRDFRGPDFFGVLGVDGTRERQGWVIWEEGGRYPDVIVELLSPSTAAADRGAKKNVYEQVFKTANYFVFDPFDPTSLEGWQLATGHGYQPLQPNAQGWLWCDVLGLWLGTWQGVMDREPVNGVCDWLRFYDPDGNLVPSPEEAAEQQAEQAQQQAKQARQQAEQAQQQAEQARQQAEQANQKAARLAARLQELGIDPEQV
jgi:Uma2 family endonuclease